MLRHDAYVDISHGLSGVPMILDNYQDYGMGFEY